VAVAVDVAVGVGVTDVGVAVDVGVGVTEVGVAVTVGVGVTDVGVAVTVGVGVTDVGVAVAVRVGVKVDVGVDVAVVGVAVTVGVDVAVVGVAVRVGVGVTDVGVSVGVGVSVIGVGVGVMDAGSTRTVPTVPGSDARLKPYSPVCGNARLYLVSVTRPAAVTAPGVSREPAPAKDPAPADCRPMTSGRYTWKDASSSRTCSTAVVLTQVTVSPALMETEAGSNPESVIRISNTSAWGINCARCWLALGPPSALWASTPGVSICRIREETTSTRKTRLRSAMNSRRARISSPPVHRPKRHGLTASTELLP
jgi:hypothetical protein